MQRPNPLSRFLLLALSTAALACNGLPAAKAAAPIEPIELFGEHVPLRYHIAWRRPAMALGSPVSPKLDRRDPAIDADAPKGKASFGETRLPEQKYDLGGGYAFPPGGTRWILNSFTEPTPPPVGDWTAADYDDSRWARQTGQVAGGLGYGTIGSGPAVEVALLCARARFVVPDLAKAGKLALALRYRGGAVVYLNGQEIARAAMPDGKVTPDTLASDYELSVFTGPQGKPLPAPPERGPGAAKVDEAYQKRFRTLEVELPQAKLRAGVNVLCIELHRAALPEAFFGSAGAGKAPLGQAAWGTCGLVSLSLKGASGVAAPADSPDPQVFTCDLMSRGGVDVKSADPLDPLGPVRLASPRGGVSSGQVVVAGSTELKGISAKLSELRTLDGKSLPASVVEIRYATPDERVPQLRREPPAETTTLPIWLSARTPRDAAAGVYRDQLTVSGLKRPISVPVELRVFNWTLPELADYGTSVSLLHSPESIARHYNVPLWSDAHFKLLAKSFELMGYAGNRLVSVSAIAEDLFGDQPLIVFTKQGDKYLPDFRFARRYLKLYGEHAPPPQFVSVQVWNYAVSARGFGRDGGTKPWLAKTIKVGLLEGDKIVKGELPVYSSAGTEETWAAVASGMQKILDELGWTKTRLLWGTGGDNLPNEEIVTFFKKFAPDVQWRVATHGGSISKWGPTPEDRTQPGGGAIVGYANLVRRNVTRKQLVPDAPIDVLKRDGVTAAPLDYYTMAPLGRIAARYSGCGFLSFDTWAFRDDSGKMRGPIRNYVAFGNLHPSGGPFVAPGPDGAAASPQVEAFREGLQVTEAVLKLREAAAADGAKPELAAEAATLIQQLMDVLESNRRVRPAGTADVWPLVWRVYELVESM